MNAIQEINGMVKKAWGFNLGSIFRNKPITHPALLRMRKRPIDYSAGENVWRGQLDAWKDDEKNNREQYARQDEAWRNKVLSDYANATGNSVATAGAMFDSFRGKMNPSQAADFKSMKMMRDASNPKVNTEAVRRQKALAYTPSVARPAQTAVAAKPAAQQAATPVASTANARPMTVAKAPAPVVSPAVRPATRSVMPAKPSTSPAFNFENEARRLLTGAGAQYRSANGGAYNSSLAKDMSQQLKDIRAGKYNESQQRSILDQWKKNIAAIQGASSYGRTT